MKRGSARRGRPPGKSSRRNDVLQAVSDRLASGFWLPGKRLPSYRELASSYGVSLMTMRLVLKELEREGRLIIRPRRQAVVAAPARGSPAKTAIAVVLNSYFASAMAWESRRIMLGAMQEPDEDSALVFLHHLNTRDELPKALFDERLRGVVLSGPFRDETLRLYEGLKLPVVLLDQPGGENFMFNSVAVNNFDGAYDATNRLIALGHRHIAFLCTISRSRASVDPDEKERRAGFEAACAAARPTVHARVFSSMNVQSRVAFEILASRPRFTGVLAANPGQALRLLKAAHSMGLNVPHHLSIVTFRSMTAIKQNWSGAGIDFRLMGRTAAELIRKAQSTFRHIRMPTVWQSGVTIGSPPSAF